MSEDGDDQEDRARQRRSLVGLAVAALLVVAGIYLVVRLHRANEIQLCLEAGHHDCDALVNSP